MTTWTAEEQKAHRKLWVEALRSGKYQQTTGTLHDAQGGFCCLGVACEISELGEWNPLDEELYRTPSYDSIGALEDDVRQWLGLRGSEGEIYTSDTSAETSLAKLNDDGKSFAEIADIIEAEPEGLIALSRAEQPK